MGLSYAQKQQLKAFRKELQDIFKKWGQNPSDFDHTIECLREMGELAIKTTAFIEPLFEKLNNPHSRMFNNEQRLRSILVEFKTNMFNDETNKLLKDVFGKEPRITNLSADKNEKHHWSRYKGSEDIEEMTYKITFKDGETVDFNDIDNENDLDGVRSIFEEKMEELENVKRHKH